MPGSQTLHRNWQEGNSLAVAGLPRLVELSAVSFTKSVTSSSRSAIDSIAVPLFTNSETAAVTPLRVVRNFQLT